MHTAVDGKAMARDLQRRFGICLLVCLLPVPLIHIQPVFLSDEPEESGLRNSTLPITPKSTERFLLYGVTSGWSNQLISLEHALWLCKLTNRTLVLPPVLTHFEKQPDHPRTGKTLSIPKIYTSLMVSRPPMKQILNLSWSAIPTMDFKDFSQTDILPPEMLKVDHSGTGKYSNCKTNTFTANRSRHGMKEYTMMCNGDAHQTKEPFEFSTARHPAMLPEQDQQVWILDFVYPLGLFDNELVEQMGDMPLLYANPIREEARRLLASWEPCVAVHVRGGDWPFSTQNWDAVFPKLNKFISETISRVGNRSATVLLLTDIVGIAQKNESDPMYQKWLQYEKEQSQQEQQENPNATRPWRTISAVNYTDSIQKLNPVVGEEAAVYLDQQLAACATLGFLHDNNPKKYLSSTHRLHAETRYQSMLINDRIYNV